MNKKLRKYAYTISSLFFGNKEILPLSQEIDVVIPVVEKDLKVLPLCLQGVRLCVNHPIKNIYIVAPSIKRIIDYCKAEKIEFIDENVVLGYSAKSINYKVGDADRSGWIFQQLLKLSASIGTCEHYLVIDADHILLRPHTFIARDGKTVFYQSKECHIPYYTIIQFLLNLRYSSILSYVDHKMLFSRTELRNMKKQIEFVTNEIWDKAILKSLDRNETSSFSEYETYGCFVSKARKKILPWRNKNLRYENMENYELLQKKYKKKYRTVTFPDYKNK